jgi:hypothetical protein
MLMVMVLRVALVAVVQLGGDRLARGWNWQSLRQLPKEETGTLSDRTGFVMALIVQEAIHQITICLPSDVQPPHTISSMRNAVGIIDCHTGSQRRIHIKNGYSGV